MGNETENQDAKSEAADSVHHIAIRPPPFDEQSATRWFWILEAQFQLSKITSTRTKFNYAISSLPICTLSKIPDAVAESFDYGILKSTVLAVYEKSKPEMFERLVSKQNISFEKPSLFLLELKKLGTQLNVGEDLIRHKFLTALPDSIRPVLLANNDTPLDELARIADTLIAYQKYSNVDIQSIQSKSNCTFSDNAANVNPEHGGGQSRYVKQSYTPRSLQPFHQNQKPKVCRGHIFFGVNARTCTNWCVWPNKDNINVLPQSRAASPARARTPPINTYPKNSQSEN
ncbi:Uncharacterised protein g1277 [Pycnogonum litorale]